MRKASYVTLFLLALIFLALVPASGRTAKAATPTKASAPASGCKVAAEKVSEGQFIIEEDKNGKPVYKGLSSYGRDNLVIAHNNLINADRIVKAKVFDMENDIMTLRICQVGRWNAMILGPPGGAKSRLVMSMIPKSDLFIKQVHAMMNETPLIGAVPKEAVDRGEEYLNTKGTILDDFPFALIDEGEKLNPAVQSVLLSLLNPGERFITFGGKRYEAKRLRSIIYTGNAILPELLEMFFNNGQGTTGPAYLNRFYAKLRIPNRVSPETQKKIDAMTEEEDFLWGIKNSYPKAMDNVLFQEPPAIDFNAIEEFAKTAFVLSPEAKVVLNEAWDELTDDTHREIKKSIADHKEDPDTHPYELTPSVEFSERLRRELQRWVKVSAAIDFLRSPLADPKNIEKYTKKKIVLSPTSLWRLWNIQTTVTNYRTVFDPFKGQIYFGAQFNKMGQLLPFNWEEAIQKARDNREALDLQYQKAEQERFVNALWNHESKMKKALEDAARVIGDTGDDFDFDKEDFEFALARVGGTDVMKVNLAAKK